MTSSAVVSAQECIQSDIQSQRLGNSSQLLNEALSEDHDEAMRVSWETVGLMLLTKVRDFLKVRNKKPTDCKRSVATSRWLIR